MKNYNNGVESGYGVYVKGTSFSGKVFIEYSMNSLLPGEFPGTGQYGNGTGILPDMDYNGSNRNSFTNIYDNDNNKHKISTLISTTNDTVYIAGHNKNPMKVSMIYAIIN